MPADVRSPASDGELRPFDKYQRGRAYHWREVQAVPTRYNAVLTARYRMVTEALRHGPVPQTILDVGCGDACLTYRMATGEARVIGVDPSLLALTLARREIDRRPRRIRLVGGSAYSLPFADETVDCLVLADVIEHLADVGRILRESQRVLRQRGQLLITTPRRRSEQPVSDYHVREFTGSELAELLRAVFTRVEVRGFQPLPAVRLYERRVLGRKVFRVLLNCGAILGINPLVGSGPLAREHRYAHLYASAGK